MIFLTKGIIQKILQRIFYWTPIVKLEGNTSIIMAYNKPPVFLRIDSIDYFVNYNKVCLKIDDGNEIVGCLLDNSKFTCLNSHVYNNFFGPAKSTIDENVADDDDDDEEVHKLHVGSVIMLLDYTFQDLHLKNNKILLDIITILDFSIVGYNDD